MDSVVWGGNIRRSDRSSLRRVQWLTSVCFAATSFPRKEANDQRIRRRWNPDDSIPKNVEMTLPKPPPRHEVCQGGEGVKSPVFPTTRKISRLIEAVAILDCRVIGHAHTARNDGHRLASVRPAGGVWIVSFGAETSDGQTVRRQTGSACGASNG